MTINAFELTKEEFYNRLKNLFIQLENNQETPILTLQATQLSALALT
jgi:hypothetical protein